jgi:hypothetical protein
VPSEAGRWHSTQPPCRPIAEPHCPLRRRPLERLGIKAYSNGEQCHPEEHEQTCLAYRGCGGERPEAVGLLRVHSLNFPCEIPDTQETGGGSKATSRYEGSCTYLRHNRRFQERILDSLDSLDSFVRLLFLKNKASRSLAGEELFLPLGPTSQTAVEASTGHSSKRVSSSRAVVRNDWGAKFFSSKLCHLNENLRTSLFSW